MINLLPPEEKQNLAEIRRQKTMAILGFTIFVFLASLALILESINIAMSSNVTVQKIALANKKQVAKTVDIKELEKKVVKANQDLENLSSFYKKTPSFTLFLAEVSDLLPEGIYLNNLSINPVKTEDNLFQIYISGYASSVEDVNLFKENLEKDENISQISFPLDIWLEKNDFIFSATFEAIIKNEI